MHFEWVMDSQRRGLSEKDAIRPEALFTRSDIVFEQEDGGVAGKRRGYDDIHLTTPQFIPHAPHSVPAQSQPPVSWPPADAQVTLSSRMCYQEGKGGHPAHCCLDQRCLHPRRGGQLLGGPPRCTSVEESSPVPLGSCQCATQCSR